MLTLKVLNEQDMNLIGHKIAKASQGVGVIYLVGDLGVGKTTISRGVLRGLGYEGTVKSPTYTLVEPYELGPYTVYHFDLYRLKDPEELELMGIRDYFSHPALSLIEWPEQGKNLLPTADLVLTINLARPQGRLVSVNPLSEHGQQIADILIKNV